MQKRLLNEARRKDIIDEKFNYEKCLKSFLAVTNQKIETAIVVSKFVNLLLSFKILSKKKPIVIADLRCANGESSFLYISKINHALRFNYVGIDKGIRQNRS